MLAAAYPSLPVSPEAQKGLRVGCALEPGCWCHQVPLSWSVLSGAWVVWDTTKYWWYLPRERCEVKQNQNSNSCCCLGSMLNQFLTLLILLLVRTYPTQYIDIVNIQKTIENNTRFAFHFEKCIRDGLNRFPAFRSVLFAHVETELQCVKLMLSLLGGV